MPELFPENSKNAQQVNGVRRNLMKKKIIYVLCILGVLLVLLGLKKEMTQCILRGYTILTEAGL